MKAMILAAGLGTRMRPLTNRTPKPLLEVGGASLLEHHLRGLAMAGFRDVVVNSSWLGEQIIAFCGDGARWGLRIRISVEPEPLETAGGIVHALPWLADDDAPFLVVNGDIYCPYPFTQLRQHHLKVGGAHLVLVPNPPQHPHGDFQLDASGRVALKPSSCEGSMPKASADDVSAPSKTFSGIGVYHPAFFAGYGADAGPMRPLLERAIKMGLVTGELWQGHWEDVGTPERLYQLREQLRTRSEL